MIIQADAKASDLEVEKIVNRQVRCGCCCGCC
jgi:hypothetical protein